MNALLQQVALLVTAAGLLRLASLDSWTAIGSVALIVVVRKLAVTGIGLGAAAGRP